MNAGINATDEALAKFNEFKMKKKLAAIVYKIDKIDGAEKVVLEKEFPKGFIRSSRVNKANFVVLVHAIVIIFSASKNGSTYDNITHARITFPR